MGCKSHLEGLRLHAQPSYVGGAISTEPQKIVTSPFHSLVVPLPHLRREVPALQCLRRWWWHPHPIQGTNGGAPSSLKRLSHGMLWDITWYMYTLCTLQTTSYSILYPGYMRIELVQVEITLSSYIGRCRCCTNPISCRKELWCRIQKNVQTMFPNTHISISLPLSLSLSISLYIYIYIYIYLHTLIT